MAKIICGGKYKRFVAIGCSHGHLADEIACAAALAFVADYKPQTRIHLGDAVDMTAFRGGAKGTADEAASIAPDLRAGLTFLEQFRPTILLNGNHEDRLVKDSFHPNALRAHAAACILNDIRQLADKMRCQYVDHYDINRSWVTLGDTKLLHGFFFNEMAIRDHAEHFGKCIIAHLHTVGMAAGRRTDHPHAWCVGTLANIPAMAYAKTRRATARWSAGLAFGEYNDKECHVNLHYLPNLLTAR